MMTVLTHVVIGALQFYALRREFVDGEKMKSKQYHDFILKNNMMPIELLRSLMKNERLQRDFAPSWRFYDGMRQEAPLSYAKKHVLREQYATCW
jgi:hypothetical protein